MNLNRSKPRPLGGGRVAERKGRRLPVSLPSFFINSPCARSERPPSVELWTAAVVTLERRVRASGDGGLGQRGDGALKEGTEGVCVDFESLIRVRRGRTKVEEVAAGVDA